MRRRELLTAAASSLSAGVLLPARKTSETPSTIYAYVGCYTSEQRHGHGDGIHAYAADAHTGAWTHIQLLDGLINPSFLITHPNQHFLYSVHGDGDYATSFRIDPSSGKIAPLNKGATGGINGVCQALSQNNRFLIVANYGSGTVAVLPVADTGELSDQIQLVPLQGSPGPHRVEQTSSHPHQIVFDPSGKFVLVPDKGLDRVFIFHFDGKSGRLTATDQGSVQTRAAAGPRHLAFHPTLPVVWVLNELNSSVATYAWDAATGSLKPQQVLPSLPPDFTGDSTAAEIAVSGDGRFVYCSNRGHDSIALYSADPHSGLLKSIGWTPSAGKTPRYIGFDPTRQFLCCANEQGDSVTQFRVNPKTGALSSLGAAISNRSAVTITFARLAAKS